MTKPQRGKVDRGKVVESVAAQGMLPRVALVAQHPEPDLFATADVMEIAPHPSVAALPRPLAWELPHKAHARGPADDRVLADGVPAVGQDGSVLADGILDGPGRQMLVNPIVLECLVVSRQSIRG